MGMYDTIMVPCPKCGTKEDFQTKSGKCVLGTFNLSDAPADAMEDVMRHGPATCRSCGTVFGVQFKIAPAVVNAKSIKWPPKPYEAMTPEEQWEHDKFNGTLDNDRLDEACQDSGNIESPVKTLSLQHSAIKKLTTSDLDAYDWSVPKIREDIEPLKAFPVSEIVQAGYGGFWVPVYIYIEKKS